MAALTVSLLVPSGHAWAQGVPAAVDTTRTAPSPAGAFLRGVLIPGWGHTVSGSLSRGAFYFGVESASGWMLYKTMRKLGAVRDRVDFWETRVRDRLAAEGVTDPALIAEALDADPDVVRTRISRPDAKSSGKIGWP